MEKSAVRALLKEVAEGKMSIDEAELRLKIQPFEDLGFAKVDHHRALRQGVPEVIFGEGKTPKQIIEISRALLNKGQRNVLITRLPKECAEYLKNHMDLKYFDMARIGLVGVMPEPDTEGTVLIVTAGTSDIPVAEEAALTCEIMGNKVKRVYDAGVAGIHRLLAHSEDIMRANVIIAAAGMEGALASAVGGLADCPVIAVPTSIGYGASFNGLSALLSMLNSCASGVSVVNIDNGFGAGYIASLINHMGGK